MTIPIQKRYRTEPIKGSTAHVIHAKPGGENELQKFQAKVEAINPELNQKVIPDTIKSLYWWLKHIYRSTPEESYADSRTSVAQVARAASAQLRIPISPELVLGMALFQGLPVIKDDSLEDPWGNAHLGLWPGDVRLQCFGKSQRYCGRALQNARWSQDVPFRCHLDCPAGRWTTEHYS